MALLKQTAYDYYNGKKFGGYQFISLDHIVSNFMTSYVGESKIIRKAKRLDIAFHAQRGLQEFSYDTFKSIKSQEITLPPSLTMVLPQDYVNYVGLAWTDSSGIEHIIYPTSKSSNPTPVLQNSDGDYALTAVGTFTDASNVITLDSEYTNITDGMRVRAPGMPSTAIVSHIKTTAGITSVTLHGTTMPNYSATETISFGQTNSKLLLEEETSFQLDGLTWAANDNKITQSPNTGVANVTVGMRIDNRYDWPARTKVVDVNGAVITMSKNSINIGTATKLTFTDRDGDSSTWANYKSITPSENSLEDYQDDDYWPSGGERYGLDPQHAQVNGSFYIDELKGKIHFSSNISGKNIVLKYISDGLGTDTEMVVHKFAEEAMYKYIAYAMLSTRLDTPETIIARLKKEKFAEIRKAKLRLSNIKIEELTQILRGKSKQIKH